jgi:aminoglycoside 6'-N-acetyltransferase
VPAVLDIRLDAFDPKLHSERLIDWLGRPHVARWWGDPQQSLLHAAQLAPETHALIVADGTPVGYLCWQRPARHELEAADLTDLPSDLMDIDILIGEPGLLGQGIGPRALSQLLARLRQDPLVQFAGLGTSASNARAIRAFEKAGFRLFREFQDPEAGLCRYMVAEVRDAG